MNFEAFQATRCFAADLCEADPNIAPEWFTDENGDPRACRIGYVYDGSCYIEDDGSGLLTLTIGNETEQSRDLEALERKLYTWVVDEGLFE